MKKYKYEWRLRERWTDGGFGQAQYYGYEYPHVYAQGYANTRKQAKEEANKHRSSHKQVIVVIAQV